MQVFSVYFWHSECWTQRNETLLEAVVMQAKVTRHPWLVAFDANMCPGDFEKSLFHKEFDACSGSERSVHVQIRPQRRAD